MSLVLYNSLFLSACGFSGQVAASGCVGSLRHAWQWRWWQWWWNSFGSSGKEGNVYFISEIVIYSHREKGQVLGTLSTYWAAS